MLSEVNKYPLSRANKAGRRAAPLKKWAYSACPVAYIAKIYVNFPKFKQKGINKY